MRHFDQDEATRLNAEPWQLELLNANPHYCSWGPHEDYMAATGQGWGSRKLFKTWAEFGPWELDDLNECVDFYFSVNRANVECSTCGGVGCINYGKNLCKTCQGRGYVFTAPKAHVSLTLWWLHPRKGCSRGLEIENIEQRDLPAISDFLKDASERNAKRFDGVGLISSRFA